VADAAGRSTLLAVRSYDVDLDVAADTDSFSSRTEIRFRCHQPGAASVADLDASAIRQVVLNGAELDPSAAWRDGQLRLPGLAAENVLTVDAGFAYASAGAAGLHRRIWSGSGGCVFSKPMPDGGRHIFCCFYQEDLRAPVTLSVTAPVGWSCLANGAAVSEPAGPQQNKWSFAPTAPIAPYAVSCCAGPFTSRTLGADSQLPVVVHARPPMADLLASLVGPDLIEQPLRYYEDGFGTAYPFGKCDVVFVPDYPPLAFGAPGLVIVQERVLSQAATQKSGLYLALVLAHELAHAWLGGLVDTRAHQAEGLIEGLTTYVSRCFLAETRPTVSPWDPDVSRTLPDDGYARYALPFLQLERRIGKQAILDGVNVLINEHRNECITGADLAGCLSRASGHDVRVVDLEPA
jgi:aminopeptidase N